jgi:hypothetical protein
MSDTTATFYGVPSFKRRVFALGDYRRAVRAVRIIGNGVVIGFGTVAAIGLLVTAVTLAAAWIVNTTLATNPHVHAKALTGPGTLALASGYPTLAKTANLAADMTFESKWARASTGAVPLMPQPLEIPDDQAKREIARARDSIQVAKLTPAAAPASAPINTLPLPPKLTPERANRVPLPLPRPIPAQQEIARAPAEQPAPQVVADAPPPPASTADKRVTPQQAPSKSMALPEPGSRTAVYDISARTVYLPNGEKLEAHSGLGDKLDNPQYVHVRMRGPTPPNVYDLTLREELFHGVRAIRLNPVDDNKMFGRDGMLAHTYMLGPNGQSNGCVSFRDYQKFLQAFLRGEVDRLVVVPNGGTKLALTASARRGPVNRYASNNPPTERNMSAW